MKKTLIFCTILVSVLQAAATWMRVTGSSNSPVPSEKEVMKSDDSGVVIRSAAFGFTEEDTTIDNKNFKRIKIPVEQIDWDTINIGKPQIPYLRLLIAVPDSADFNITAYESPDILFEDYLLYPVPNIVFEQDTEGCFYSKEVYAYDTSFYEKDTLYPDKFYEVISDGHWRDQRVLEVFVYPIQFNPQQEKMYFYDRIDLRIEYTGTVVENTSGLGPFEEIAREILLNYPGIDKQPPPCPPPAVHYYTDLLDTNNIADYIAVTHDHFLINDTYSYWINEFAQWRVDHNAFDVAIVKVQDIFEQFDSLAPDSAAQLRHFLTYAYDNWTAPGMLDSHFAYCLFIGDWDYVPAKFFTYYAGYSGQEWLGTNESYFVNLDQDPLGIQDFMLGRWPVKGQELVTIAQKTINYEQYPVTEDTFRRRGILSCGFNTHNQDFDFEYYVDSATAYFCDIMYDTITVRSAQLDAQQWRDSMNHYVNSGEILTVYYGHGGPETWQNGYDTTEVKGLKNDNRLPVVLSNSCYTAMFQWDHPYYQNHPYTCGTCFGEHFLFNPDGGAVAFYGATIADHFPVRNPLELVLRRQHWILGEFACNGYFGNYYYCILGDPALDIGDYTAFPNLPDLVVRPRGIDITPSAPYPYPSPNATIPIKAKIWNIGGAAAYNVDVKFEVVCDEQLIYDTTVSISEIQPRDTAIATTYWNTGQTHPNYIGEIGDCDFIVTADPDDMIDESWPHNNEADTIKKVIFYPPGWSKKCPYLSSRSWESVPALANLDGQGSVEIVYAGLDSLYVFKATGENYNDWPEYFEGVYGVVLGDIDINGWTDIAAVSESKLRVYFNYNGEITFGWEMKLPYSDYAFSGLPALGHIQEQIIPEPRLDVVMLAYQPSNKLKILVYDYEGSLEYEGETSEQVVCLWASSPAVENVLRRGADEVVISYAHPRKTEVFNCKSASPQKTLDYGSRGMTPALVDIDGDNKSDIVVGAEDRKVYAYDVWNDESIWETNLTQGPIFSSSAVGNINSTPQFPGNEIAFGNLGNEIYAIEHTAGDWWFPWPYTAANRVSTSPALARLEGIFDLNVDIVTGADDEKLYAFNYQRQLIPPYPLTLFGVPNSAVIGDVDGDRRSETILSSDDGYLHVWENINSDSWTPYELEWPQFHHDYQRTGLHGWLPGFSGGDASPGEFSTATTISFALKDTVDIQIKIYDEQGNAVKALVAQTLPEGTYHPIWQGKDNNYALLPNGVYFIEFKVRNKSKIVPVIINR